MELLDIIDDFNSGAGGIVDEYFGGYENFFNVLKRRNLLHLIDPNGAYSDEWQSEFFLYLMENDMTRLQEIFEKDFFYDVKFYDGQAYLELSYPSELARLFCDDRNTNQDLIEQILGGNWDYIFDDVYIDNVYDDIIHPLGKDPDKLNYLKKSFIDELNSVEVYPKTNILQTIASQQDKDYPTIDNNNIDEVFRDSKTVNYLLKEYLDDLDSNLRNLYSAAYNDAYLENVHDEIMDKLSKYFLDAKWDSYLNNKGKKDYIYRCKIQDFWSIVKDILIRDSKYSRTLDYYGTFLSALEENTECLRYYAPDYADSHLVDSNVRDMLYDYV
jgi:hypothetical protein